MSYLTTPFERAVLRAVNNNGVVDEWTFSIFANTLDEVIAYIESNIRPMDKHSLLLLRVEWRDDDAATDHLVWNDALHEFTLL